LIEVRQIQYHVVKVKAVSPAEITRLRVLANDESPFVRARARTALCSAGTDKTGKDAAVIARAKLTDKEAMGRVYALRVLEGVTAPDLIEQANKLLKDPDAHVRERAAGIIKAHS
jgi:HEAT repeat protein